MLSIKLSWSAIKDKGPLRYVQTNGNYYIYVTDANTEWSCVLLVSAASEFEELYKSSATNLA